MIHHDILHVLVGYTVLVWEPCIAAGMTLLGPWLGKPTVDFWSIASWGIEHLNWKPTSKTGIVASGELAGRLHGLCVYAAMYYETRTKTVGFIMRRRVQGSRHTIGAFTCASHNKDPNLRGNLLWDAGQIANLLKSYLAEALPPGPESALGSQITKSRPFIMRRLWDNSTT